MVNPIQIFNSRISCNINSGAKSKAIWRGIFYTFWSIFSGLAIALALPPYAVPGLIWVALVPFFALLYFPIKSERQRFFFGWIAGIAATWPTFGFFFDAAPILRFGAEGLWTSYGLAVFGSGLPVLFFAVMHGAFLVVARRLILNKAFDVMTLASLWALFEYVRTFAYSFHPFAAGSGAILGDHMSFGLIGYGLADYENVRQFAAVIGLYGLGFIVATSSAAAFWLLRLWKQFFEGIVSRKVFYRQTTVFSLAGAAVFSVMLFAGPMLKTWFIDFSRSVRVALVQMNLTPEDYADPQHFEKIGKTMEPFFTSLRENKEPFDVVLAPESSGIFNRPNKPVPTLDEVKKLLGQDSYRIIFDGIYARRGENQLAMYDNETGFVSKYSKRFLMPYGEYMPTLVAAIFRAFGQGDILKQGIAFVPGTENAVRDTRFGKVGTMLCSEILSPQLIRETAKDGAEIFLFSSSIAILRNSPKYHSEVLSMTKIWAAATRRYFVYAGNNEPVFVVDPAGNLVWQSQDVQPKVHVVEVKLTRGKTFYANHPFAFIYTISAYLVGVAFVTMKIKRKEA